VATLLERSRLCRLSQSLALAVVTSRVEREVEGRAGRWDPRTGSELREAEVTERRSDSRTWIGT
jgi:hypothetical protein